MDALFYGGVFQCLSCFASAALLYATVSKSGVYLKKDWDTFGGLVLILCACSSLFFAYDISRAIPGVLQSVGAVLFYLFCIQQNGQSGEGFRQRGQSTVVYLCFGIALFGILLAFSEELGFTVLSGGRLAVFIRYPNTLGAVMLGAVPLSLCMNKTRGEIVLFQGILWTAVILSFSRACYILGIPIFFTMLFVGKKQRKEVLCGFVLGVALGVALSLWGPFLDPLERAASVNVSATEWQERLFYYRDALPMIWEHPLGSAPWGSYLLQGQYQTAWYYDIPYLHCGPLQAAADFGILAAVVFCGMFAGYFWRGCRLREDKALFERLSCFVLFAHGMVDFDWKFSSVLFLMFFFLGAEPGKLTGGALYIVKKSVICTFLCGIMCVCIWSALYTYFIAEEEYDAALKINPCASAALAAVERFEEAKKYSSNRDEVIYLGAYQSALKINNEAALDDLKKLTELRPLSGELKEKKGALCLALAEEYVEKGDREKALARLDEVINIQDEVAENAAKVHSKAYKLKHKPCTRMTENLKEYVGEAKKLQKELYSEGAV